MKTVATSFKTPQTIIATMVTKHPNPSSHYLGRTTDFISGIFTGAWQFAPAGLRLKILLESCADS